MKITLLEVSLVLLGLGVCSYSAVSITIITHLTTASPIALSHVLSAAVDNGLISCGIILGLCALVVLAGLLLTIFHLYHDWRYVPFYLDMLLLGSAISGIVACGYMLDTLNQIRGGAHLTDAFLLIMKHDSTKLQTLLESETALIAGIVVCSVATVGLIVLACCNFMTPPSKYY